MVKKLILTLLIVSLSGSLSFGVESKSLYLNKDSMYLLLFENKVEEFKASKDDVINVSLMTTIFNDKHQVILKPLKNEDINIIFWTQDEVFNFDVFVDKDKQSEKIINISSAQKKEIEKFSDEIGEEIDLPPEVNDSFEGFKIDLPPLVKEVK